METSKEDNKIKKILAPDLNKQREIKNTFKEISYYLIIGLISILVVFVIPLISGALYGDMGMYFPKSVQGWILYWCIKGGSALANVALFVLFKLQAKTNIRRDPNYLEARRILQKHVGEKEFIPRSPTQMNLQEYIIKGITVLITTLGASVTISLLIISFDFVTFLSCIVSTIIALCFGWVTMIKNEIYWTEEYLEYAKYIDKKSNQQEVVEVLPQEETKEEAECSALETKNSETCKNK